MRWPAQLCLIVALLSTPPAPAAGAPQAQGHVIKLQRPAKTGNRFNEITSARYETTRLTRDYKNVLESEAERFSIHLNVDQQVLATTPGGAPKSYRLEIREFVKADDKGRREILFKPGTVIVGTAGAQGSSFRIEGGDHDVDDQNHGYLTDLFGMSDKDDAVGMDDVYATAGPWQPGEARGVNQNAALQWFQNPRDPRLVIGLSGESRLIKVAEVDGVKCFFFGHSTSVRSRQRFNALNIGNAFAIPEDHFLSAMLSVLPVDNVSMERGYTSMKRQRYIMPDGDSPDGLRQEVIVESHYHTKITPLPPAPVPSPVGGAAAADDDDAVPAVPGRGD